MKKVLNLMIAICCVLSCALIFSGCDITKCEHIASEDWAMNKTHHWHECSDCGEKLDKEEHDWDEGNVLVEATKTEKGVIYYVCQGCGMDKIEEYSITTVTEEEWDTALNFNNFDKFKMTFEIVGNGNGFLSKDGDIYYQLYPDGHWYYSIENDKYYRYREKEGVWEKSEIDEEEYYNSTENMLILTRVFGDYSDAIYNQELGAYQFETNSGEVFTMYFISGRCVKFEAENCMNGGERVSINTTIEYSDFELELPTEYEVVE